MMMYRHRFLSPRRHRNVCPFTATYPEFTREGEDAFSLGLISIGDHRPLRARSSRSPRRAHAHRQHLHDVPSEQNQHHRRRRRRAFAEIVPPKCAAVDARRRARRSLTNTVNVATNAPESPRKLGLNTFGANGAARTANAIDAMFTKSAAARWPTPRCALMSFPRRDDSNRDDAARDGGDRTVDVERAREESVELPASEDAQDKSDEVVEAED